MVTVGTNGVIRHWGRDWVDACGYTAEEAVGQSLDLVIPPELRTRHWSGFDTAVSRGELEKDRPIRQAPGRHKSGAIVALRLDFNGFEHDEDGRVVALSETVAGLDRPVMVPVWRAVLALLRGVERIRAGRAAAR
jgi:PAS domain S-box-containing protein